MTITDPEAPLAPAPAPPAPQPATKPKRPGAPWPAISAIAAALSAVALAVALFVGFRTAKELREGREQELAALAVLGSVRDEIHAAQATSLVNLAAAPHVCFATNSEVTCTVTNPTAGPITTCFHGTIAQKKARGVHLGTIVGCTGRVAPHDTRVVSAPWSGGFAKDVCSSSNRFGTDMLDWDACDFNYDGVTDADLEKLAQASK